MAAVALWVLVPGGARCQPSARSSSVELMAPAVEPETEAAIEAGLDYLLAAQQSTGGIRGEYAVAVTSLAGLAVLGAGYQPQRAAAGRLAEPQGRYAAMGQMLEGCYRFLKRNADARGYITEKGRPASRMHGHSYAVLFLSQYVGSLPEQIEREAAALLRQGVRVIEQAQSRRGGWWYEPVNPGREKDEGSVTVCALQALRAARNAGIGVDKGCIDQALQYLKDSQNDDGSIRYSLSEHQDRTTFALTAAAVSTFNAAGVYRSPELRKGLDFLRRELSEHRRRPERAVEEEWFYYGHLYAAQAFFQEGGPTWSDWYPRIREHLLERRKNGNWTSRHGDEYATAVALLILELPLGYLPIFQR